MLTTEINLGVIYKSQGKYSDAESLFNHALNELRDNQLGENHPYVLLCVHNLATIYQAQGKYITGKRFMS